MQTELLYFAMGLIIGDAFALLVFYIHNKVENAYRQQHLRMIEVLAKKMDELDKKIWR